ncbi:MAG: HU family DNA-binding protein [Bacteroidales bacterium]|jgi:predicted histone-like DNA-binding protein|nr:HU family DNA-binding protein [Bacteroidales bacterium]
MAVQYTVTEKGNPQKPDAPKKWYANAKSSGEKTLRSLGKEIAARSTVSPADTQAVLVALTEVLAEELSDGKIVRLGDFGAFQVSISSDGAETEAKFNASMVKNQKVVFRAGIDLREMLRNLKFEKVVSAKSPSTSSPNDDGDDFVDPNA